MAMIGYEEALPGAVQRLSNGFGALFNGDFQGFFSNIISSEIMTVVGVFLFSYLLMHYLIRKLLIRDQEHKKTANGIALGFGLIATATPSVFNVISGFFTQAFVLAIILLAVFLFLNVFNLGRGSFWRSGAYANKGATEWSRSAAETHQADHDLDKLVRENNREDRLLRREKKNISKAQDEIAGVKGFLGIGKKASLVQKSDTLRVRLEKIAQIISSISSLREQGITGERKAQLSRELAAEGAILRDEYNELERLKEIMTREKKLEVMDLNLEHGKKMDEAHIRVLLSTRVQQGMVNKIEKSRVNEALAEDARLTQITAQAKSLAQRKSEIIDQVASMDQDALQKISQLSNEFHQIHQLLSQGNAADALTPIQDALRVARLVEAEEKQMKSLLTEWDNLRKSEKLLHNQSVALVKDMKVKLDKVAKTDKQAAK